MTIPRKIFLGLAAVLAVYAWYAVEMPKLDEIVRTKTSAVALKITLRATGDNLAQLYYDVGRGYQEESSLRVSTPKTSKAVDDRFLLPPETIFHLRFDPTVSSGESVIEAASFVDGHDRILYRFSLAEFAPLNQIQSLTRQADGLHILTTEGAQDPALSIDVTYPLTFSERARLSTGRWVAILWWHTFHGIVLATLVAVGFGLARGRGLSWLGLSPAGVASAQAEEIFPTETLFYLVGVVAALVAGGFFVEESLLRWLTS